MNALALLTRFGLTKPPAGGGGEANIYEVTGALSGPFSGSGNYGGFAFTPGEDITATAIEVYSSHEPGDLSWILYDYTASANVLTSSGEGAITPVTNTWARVTFGSPQVLLAGRTYGVMAQRTGWQRYAIDVPADYTLDSRVSFVGSVGSSSLAYNDLDPRVLGLTRLVLQA